MTPGDDAEGAPRLDGSSLRGCKELWFALARRPWRSVVLVPVGVDGVTQALGNSLAELGTRLSEDPVRAMAFTAIRTESAFVLADIQQHLRRMLRRREPSATIEVGPSTPAEGAAPAGVPVGHPAGTLDAPPASRLVITIPSVLSEPLGLAATQNADAVVLVVEMGRTKVADALRTIELVGRERIAGCLTVS